MNTEKKTVFVLQIFSTIGALFVLFTRKFSIDFISVIIFLGVLHCIYSIYKVLQAKQ